MSTLLLVEIVSISVLRNGHDDRMTNGYPERYPGASNHHHNSSPSHQPQLALTNGPSASNRAGVSPQRSPNAQSKSNHHQIASKGKGKMTTSNHNKTGQEADGYTVSHAM